MKHLLAASLLALILGGAAHADNWPQWRGPTNDGICKESNLPSEWSATKNVVWKLPMPGQAGSTPIIWGDRIFLTSQDGKDLVLMCVSTDGKELWKRKIGEGQRQFRGGEGNMASPSPSTDGKHVWAYFGNGDFACFDFDGKEIWKFNAQQRYGKFNIQHGMHTTPLLDGDRLYFQLLHSGAWLVMALDKATGKELWKIERKSDAHSENEHSYASPVIWRSGTDGCLIVHGNDYATAHRLEDGSEIWRAGDLNPKDKYNPTLRFVASPAASADLIVVPSAKQRDVVGIKPNAAGFIKTGSENELWRRSKGTPDVPSPLIHDGLVYLNGDERGGVGWLVCLDAKTGNQHYKQGVHRSIYRASPVYADGKVYLTARDGTITVVKAGPKFQEIAVNKLPDDTSASPAISNGRIYIRGWKTLYAIGR